MNAHSFFFFKLYIACITITTFIVIYFLKKIYFLKTHEITTNEITTNKSLKNSTALKYITNVLRLL